MTSFNGSDGAYLGGGVILDSSGDLLGTTEIGGASGDGVAFEIVPNYAPIAVTDDATSVTVSPAPVAPTITGTLANQPLPAGSTDKPFYSVTIGDANFGADDRSTITLTGGGRLADELVSPA